MDRCLALWSGGSNFFDYRSFFEVNSLTQTPNLYVSPLIQTVALPFINIIQGVFSSALIPCCNPTCSIECQRVDPLDHQIFLQSSTNGISLYGYDSVIHNRNQATLCEPPKSDRHAIPPHKLISHTCMTHCSHACI
ncbi:hypothetical protein TNCV_3601191 [Trichonephila clavipes]|nr:hypothetical protein TNCV_3601191 [Trichonephila clavipes]